MNRSVSPFLLILSLVACSQEEAQVQYPPSLTDVRIGNVELDDPSIIVPDEPFVPGVLIAPEQYTLPGEDAAFRTDLSAMEDLDDPEALEKHRNDTAYSYTYAAGEGDLIDLHAENDLSYDDVNQGAIGDCYFAGALSSVLFADTDRTVRDGLIREIKGTDGLVKKFAVRFYDARNRPFDVMVDAQIYRRDGKALYMRSADTRVGEEEWAPSLIEKAYAQWRSNVSTGFYSNNTKTGYEQIGNGGYAGDVMQALTWTTSQNRSITYTSDTTLYSSIATAIQTKKPVAASTPSKFQTEAGESDETDGVYANHVYVVLGARTADDGTKFIKLRNPWGYRKRGEAGLNNGEFELSLADFRRIYTTLYIGGGFKRDTTAPASVTDLEVVASTPEAVTLSFTASGDDGRAGLAKEYDLRVSSQPITAQNFSAATSVPVADPETANSEETVDITNLASGTWYAALRVEDEAGNLSPLSNVVTFTVDGASGSAVRFDFETDAQGWVGTGLFHRTQENGSWLFRFADSDQDNYDVGERPEGSLTSAVLSVPSGSPYLSWQQLLDVESGEDYDVAVLEVSTSTSGYNSWTPLWSKSLSSSEFASQQVGLAAYAGQSVRFRFRFDAMDDYENAGRGWFIDNVVLGAQ